MLGYLFNCLMKLLLRFKMVTVSRFTGFGGQFDFELDSSVKTVQSNGMFFSFFLKVGMAEDAVAGDTSPLQRIELSCQSTNLAITSIQMSDNSLYGGLNAFIGTSERCITGFFGTGGTSGSAQALSYTATTGTNYYGAVSIPFNRWLHICARKNRAAPGGIRLSGSDISLQSSSVSSIASTPQSGIKMSLQIEGSTPLDSVHLSNIWCACEGSEVADFDDEEYLLNFFDNKGQPIEIAGDGTIGGITPVFYFKGENNDPLFDSVSRTQAITNASSSEVYQKDFSVFLKTRRASIYSVLDSLEGAIHVGTRPSGLLRSSTLPGDRDPLLSFTIAECVSTSVTNSSPSNFQFGYVTNTGPDSGFSFQTTNRAMLTYDSSAYRRTVDPADDIRWAGGAAHHALMRANDSNSIEVFINNDSKDIAATATHSSNRRFYYAQNPLVSFAIHFSGTAINANPQIDWFGDASAFTSLFVNSLTRKPREGGFFGDAFLNVKPTAYNNNRSRFWCRRGALIHAYNTTPTAVPAYVEESRHSDEYGFEFYGNDYQP